MATWAHIDSLTSAAAVHSICSDKVDAIYWVEDASEDVYQYLLGSATETKIVDASVVWTYPITSVNLTLCYFSNGLYLAAALYDTVAGYSIYNVYKWDGIPNSLTLVDTIGPHVVAGDTSNYYIFTDNNYTGMVTYAPSTFIGAFPRTFAEPLTRVSTDGLFWVDASFHTRTPGILYGGDTDYPPCWYHGEIYGRFAVEETTALNYVYSIYRYDLDLGEWFEVKYGETHGYIETDASLDVHWTTQNNWSEVTNDLGYNAYTTQDSNVSVVYNFNTPYMLGITNAAGDVAVYYFPSGTWGLLDNTIADAQFDYTSGCFIELDSYFLYYLGYNAFSGDFELWSRDEPLLPPTGVSDRLWIYKTTDGGLTWASRGLMTT